MKVFNYHTKTKFDATLFHSNIKLVLLKVLSFKNKEIFMLPSQKIEK